MIATKIVVCFILLLLFIIINNGVVLAGTFLGVGRCEDCQQFFLASVDDLDGQGQNISALPPNLFGQSTDLIHIEADPRNNVFYLLYAYTPIDITVLPGDPIINILDTKTDYRGPVKPVAVTFNLNASAYVVSSLEDKIKGLYSMCYWPGDVLYGLGWLPGDTPYTLTAFTLSKDDFTVESIVQLPGSYIVMPDCAFNPATNKLYFYSRNVGVPHTMNIWEVDVEQYIISNMWTINGSLWSHPFLFQYNPTDGKMYALVDDGQLSTWLVQFDPTLKKVPFTKILQLPDQIMDSNAISYDSLEQSFVYIYNTEIVRVNQNGIYRLPLEGIPNHSLKKISFLK